MREWILDPIAGLDPYLVRDLVHGILTMVVISTRISYASANSIDLETRGVPLKVSTHFNLDPSMSV